MPYLCPHCLRDAMKRGSRRPGTERPRSMLAARDLPRCQMSDFLEGRLREALSHDRVERAQSMQLSPETVVWPEGLMVRVVQASDKRCDVKPRFEEHFK